MSTRVDFNSYAFLRYIRYLHAATVISKKCMVIVMCTYTEGKTTKTFKEDMLQYYGSNPNKKTPEGRYKNDFTESERLLLEDEYVTPESFDITLNDKVIRRMHLLTGLAFHYEKIWSEDDPPGSNSSIEHLLYKVKSHRNKVCHETINLTETELQNILKDLHNLYSTLVEKVLKAKNKPLDFISKKLDEIKQDFESLKNPICEELTDEAIKVYSKENKDFLKQLRKKVKESCQYYLVKLYEELYDRNPAEWLAFTQPLDAEEIFTELIIKEEDKSLPNNSNIPGRPCDYREILTAKTQKQKTPRLITLTGVGGNGKSTCTRTFVCKWGRKKECFVGLRDVDVLLFFELRDHSHMSFDEMLRYRCSEVLSDVGMTFSKLKEIILDLKLLIILDGQDEAVQNNLLNDVLRLVATNTNIKLMVTTRPSASIALKDAVSQYQVPQLELMIIGIAKEHQLAFIEKYVVAMETDKNKQSKIMGMVSDELPHLNDSLGEIMQSPLILALLSILWVAGEILVSATTTEIFMKFSKHLRGKLLTRLLKKMTSTDKKTLMGLLAKFEAYLAETAYSAFYYQETTLKEETLDLLKDKLKDCKLDAYEEDIFGHYLLPKKSKKNLELVIQYCFKHPRIMEHEASNFICHILSQDNKDIRIEMNQQFIIHQLQEQRFCNIRIHTIYMLAVNHPHLFTKFGNNLIANKDSQSSSDAVDNYLNAVLESKINKAVVKMVSLNLSKLDRWEVSNPSSLASLIEVIKLSHPKVLCLNFNSLAQLPSSFMSYLQTIVTYNLTLELPLSENDYLKVVLESEGNKAVLDMVASNMAKFDLPIDGCLKAFIESKGNKEIVDMLTYFLTKLRKWTVTDHSVLTSLLELLQNIRPNILNLKFGSLAQLPTSYIQTIMTYNLTLELSLSDEDYLNVLLESKGNKAVFDMVASNMAKLNVWEVTNPSGLVFLMEVMQINRPNKLHLKFNDQKELPTSFTSDLHTIMSYNIELVLELSIDNYLKVVLESQDNKSVVDMVAFNMAKKNDWTVTNPSGLASLMEVMQLTQPKKLAIHFDKQEQIPTSITKYLQTIVTYDLELDLRLPHHYKYKRAIAADNEHLLATVQPQAQAKLIRFYGYISSEAIQQLPLSLTDLCVVLLADDLATLFLKVPDLVKLTWLVVAVKPSKLECVSELPTLQPLPDLGLVTLTFNGEDVSDWHHMAVLLQRINIGRKITLDLTESNITGGGTINLLKNISKQQVTCRSIHIWSTQLPTEEEQKDIKTQLRSCCRVALFWFCGEKTLCLDPK